MSKLNTTKVLVKTILEEVEEARNSDMRLYFEVCKRLNAHALEYPFAHVILRLEALHLPPFESVRRTRQKVQAEYPNLSANDEVSLYRAENEAEYRDFARGAKVYEG